MIERVYELLKTQNIINSQVKLLPITEGCGGAYIFSAEDKYIIKYSYLHELEKDIRKQCIKEYYFYKCYSEDFIPEIVYQYLNNDEILIIMKKYSPINIGEWTEDLQKSVIDIYARMNKLDISDLLKSLPNETKDQSNDTELKDESSQLLYSYNNWKYLQEKFSNYINETMLKEMYINYKKITELQINIPKTFCHGDFHPQNILRNKDKLIFCDWQCVNLGEGIEDISFFISRGVDMGLNINKDNLIKWYAESFYKYTNIKIDIKDSYKKIACSEFLCSFKFWAEYLQNSNLDRVLNIYNSMVDSYKIALCK